jgi:hypothetical protein
LIGWFRHGDRTVTCTMRAKKREEPRRAPPVMVGSVTRRTDVPSAPEPSLVG